MRLQPAWAVHLRPGSWIPLEDEAARLYLRRGSVPEALLAGGPRPALVVGDLALSHLGLQLLGATVVGMNPAFKEAEAEQILSDSGAAMVLVDGTIQPLIESLRPRLPAVCSTAPIGEIGPTHPHPDPPPHGGREI